MWPPPAKFVTVAGTTQDVLPMQAFSTTTKDWLALPILPVAEQIPSLKPALQLPAVVPNEAKMILSMV